MFDDERVGDGGDAGDRVLGVRDVPPRRGAGAVRARVGETVAVPALGRAVGVSIEPSEEMAALWDATDVPVAAPVPPAEQVAFWEFIDAQLGEPEPPVEFGEPVVDGLDDFALVELIGDLEREASCARARQLIVVEALSRRESMNPFWPVKVSQPNITAEEVAAALGTSRAAGRTLVDTARLLAGPLLPTAAALRCGDIDWGKAKIFAAVLGDVAVQVAVDVQARVLPDAGRRTHAQLRRDLAKALIVVDPTDAEQRTVRAVDKRRVCHPKRLADGMAGIWAVLPAAVATQIDNALSTAARTARTAGDPRTPDQLRADTLAAALTGTCGHGSLGVGAFAAGPFGPGASIGGLTGVGSCCVGAFGSGASNGGSCAAGPSAAGTSTSGACGRGCAGVRVDVTVSLATLLGADENPGELAGYGPITAQTARRLAAVGTWRRLVTDPTSGTVLDVGTTRYRPPDDLAAIIRARDTRCLLPICEIPSHRCELDHRDPFHPDGTGGSTSAANLNPLCKRDHLIKTHARWRLTRSTDGTATWTTPTGHVYHHRPEPPPGHEPPLAWDPAPPPF
ncbi:DUF222 domain-containing protein [Pengzhenrongella phosphoraccumulans]|uniref:HNH endonuclease n=1 Tax=Pengzhenrongella phosphoraccumulans TaxID=3114394 RepID=UPI0038904205